MPAIVAVVMSMALVTRFARLEDGPVWFWFATCGGPNMTLEFRFDRATIEKVTMPLCRHPAATQAVRGKWAASRSRLVAQCSGADMGTRAAERGRGRYSKSVSGRPGRIRKR